jgi:hypothetical protein
MNNNKFSKRSGPQEIVTGQKSGIPNYFIGIRLACPFFKALVMDMQNDISMRFPQLKKCLTSPLKLHLTCFVMELSSDADLETAIECFHACEDYICNTFTSSSASSSISVSTQPLPLPGLLFNNMSTFSTNVLYLSPTLSHTAVKRDAHGEPISHPSSSSSHNTTMQSLYDINAHMTEKFKEANLLNPVQQNNNSKIILKEKKWTPHCTIAKTTADRKHGRYLIIYL